jgi:hypothetical protein
MAPAARSGLIFIGLALAAAAVSVWLWQASRPATDPARPETLQQGFDSRDSLRQVALNGRETAAIRPDDAEAGAPHPAGSEREPLAVDAAPAKPKTPPDLYEVHWLVTLAEGDATTTRRVLSRPEQAIAVLDTTDPQSFRLTLEEDECAALAEGL